MIYRSLVRALITSAALAAGALLAGCNSNQISLAHNAKANQPVPAKLHPVGLQFGLVPVKFGDLRGSDHRFLFLT